MANLPLIHINGYVGKALNALRKDFAVIGSRRLRGWHGWFTVGLIAGIAVGIVYVVAPKPEPVSLPLAQVEFQASRAASPITFVDKSYASSASNVTSLTVTIPSTVQPGDLLLVRAFFHAVRLFGTTSDTINGPPDWTKIPDSSLRHVTLFYRVATADMPPTATFSWSSNSPNPNQSGTVELLAYRNVATANPIVGMSKNEFWNVANDRIDVPSIDVGSTANTMLVFMAVARPLAALDSISVPPDMDSSAGFNLSNKRNSDVASVWRSASGLFSGTGATGIRTGYFLTSSGTNTTAEASIGHMVALRPLDTTSTPFDFALTTEGSKSVVQGSSVTNTVTSTLSAGTSQPISFAATGLPSGTSASFSPTSCVPTCSTMLTITTSSTTPTGTSTITVTGTGGGITRTTTFSLTVTTPSDTNLLQNPGFESDMANWTGRGTIVVASVHSGTKALQIVASSTAQRIVYQQLAVTGGRSYTASGWIKTDGLTGGARLRLQWRDTAGKILRTDYIGNTTGTADWVQKSGTFTAPLTAVSVRFGNSVRIESDNAGQAWFDDLSFTAQ